MKNTENYIYPVEKKNNEYSYKDLTADDKRYQDSRKRRNPQGVPYLTQQKQYASDAASVQKILNNNNYMRITELFRSYHDLKIINPELAKVFNSEIFLSLVNDKTYETYATLQTLKQLIELTEEYMDAVFKSKNQRKPNELKKTL